MPTISSSQLDPNKRSSDTSRLRVSSLTAKLVHEFCGKHGSGIDEALTDLILNYELIRSGGYGGELSALISELSLLESVNASIVKTNLNLVAEMRNLQAAQYIAMGAKATE